MAADTATHSQTATVKDIVVVIQSTSADEAAIAAAEALATPSGVHGAVVLAMALPPAFFVDDGFAGSTAWASVITSLRDDGEKERQTLAARLAKGAVLSEIRSTEVESLMSRHAVIAAARHADLTIFSRPSGDKPSAFIVDLIESALFNSGRPVMLVPPNWKASMPFKRIAVAWNGSREAARAVSDALPFLKAADAVTIITVDAEPSAFGVGDAPGADISTHLARHGVNVELRNVDGMGRGDGDAIAQAAREAGADLIVLGAYGHSRMQQMVFGGVTKHLLHTSEIPMLMSH